MTNQIEIPHDLQNFLNALDENYRSTIANIALFDGSQTSKWTNDQKRVFAGIFYHLRGHFIDFMWYLANFCKDDGIKSIVMENIGEELGIGGKFSHEELYGRFSQECGIDIKDEIINEKHHADFAKQFNKEHLKWLSKHTVSQQLALFAAYERLDNIDYPRLYEFAKTLGVSEHALTFFRVHIYVEHFDSTLDKLLPIWHSSPNDVKEAFEFIYGHQLQMWQQLSDAIFSVPQLEAIA